MAQKRYIVEVHRSLFANDGFPPPIEGLDSCWDFFCLPVEKNPKQPMLGRREFIDGKLSSRWFGMKGFTPNMIISGEKAVRLGKEDASKALAIAMMLAGATVVVSVQAGANVNVFVLNADLMTQAIQSSKFFDYCSRSDMVVEAINTIISRKIGVVHGFKDHSKRCAKALKQVANGQRTRRLEDKAYALRLGFAKMTKLAVPPGASVNVFVSKDDSKISAKALTLAADAIEVEYEDVSEADMFLSKDINSINEEVCAREDKASALRLGFAKFSKMTKELADHVIMLKNGDKTWILDMIFKARLLLGNVARRVIRASKISINLTGPKVSIDIQLSAFFKD